MKRRLNIAAGAGPRPELILLDEPTVGVDPQSRNAIFDNIAALRRDGHPSLYTTHYMEEAERLCDRIAIVDRGRLLAIGTLAELLAAHGATPILVVRTEGGERRLPPSIRSPPSTRWPPPRGCSTSTSSGRRSNRSSCGSPAARCGTEDTPMRQIVALALKDLRLLPRIRMAFFFTVLWPVIVAVLFGFAFGGNVDGTPSTIPLALVDEDATVASRAFAQRLEAGGHFALTAMSRAEAETAVRRGQRTAYLVLPEGFGAASERMFYGQPRQVLVGSDPSRTAETGMIEGLLMKAAAEDMQRLFSDTAASTRMVDTALQDLRANDDGGRPELARFLGELKTFVGSPAVSAPGSGRAVNWTPLQVTAAPVVRERRGPANAFEVTFPQGVLWGLIGCVMSFGLSLVSRADPRHLPAAGLAPLSRAQILAGKAAACFVAMLAVQALLYALGVVAFGIRPSSWAMLALGSLCASVAFCGFMMLVATLGRTEQAASGTAWAILMPMSLVGGGMVPQFVMPAWMSTAGTVSPVKWAIRAIEGGLWRQFTLAEMSGPCAFLLLFGVACFALGTRRLTVD